MKASEFDQQFDAGKDVTSLLDLSQAHRPGMDSRNIDVDLPEWMLQSLDKEACKLGVTRQLLIKLWVADKLKHLNQSLTLK